MQITAFERQIDNIGKNLALLVLAGVCAIGLTLMSDEGRAEDDANPISVGVLTGPAPYYSFSEATGEPIGFALEMWKEVAKRAGLAYQLVYFDTVSDLLDAAKSKTIDVVPLLVANPKASALFDFSETIHVSPVSILVRKDGVGINRASDLAGHRVSVVDGHIGRELMSAFRGELSISHESLDEALSALMTKTSDAVVYQEYILWQLARQQGVDSLLKTVDQPLRKLKMSIAIRKGQPQLRAELGPAVTSYLQSSEFYAARQPWGGNPPPLIEPTLVAKLLGALLAMAVIGLGLWRHFSMVRLNAALARSVREQQSAEARFKDVAEAASDWFFEQDENFRFTFVSSRFGEVTGIPPERLIGRTRWNKTMLEGTSDDAEKWREHVAALKAHKDWRDFSYLLKTIDGQNKTITTSGKAIFDADGKFVGYRGVGRDITRRIELEGALQQSQKMELVGQLTGGIAHDFNNLLTVMVGNLEMLKRSTKDDARSRVFLETASEAVDIGAQLVQRLLGFARRQALNPSTIDLNQLVSNMQRLIHSSLGPTIDIKLELASEIPPVFADEVQLQNVLLNLAINARDAMPSGGRLTVETSEFIADKAYSEKNPSAVPGRYIVLRIIDSGNGIAKENLDKVVEPFFTTKEVGKGSGLGLSMVYGFARQSNGFMMLDSEVGVGTTVSIHLPVASATLNDLTSDASEENTRPARLENGTGHTILVVDDDDRVREITTVRLQHLGYHVLDAHDATTALKTLEQRSGIDLLLTDIVMPGMSGIDLAAEVGRTRPEIKILFSASYSSEAHELEEKGKLGGPWLRKPYKQADLERKMIEVLGA